MDDLYRFGRGTPARRVLSEGSRDRRGAEQYDSGN